VTSEIAFVDSYTCPRCLAELEPPGESRAMWLRCPGCGRASLPPDRPVLVPRSRPVQEGLLFIGPEPDPAPVGRPVGRPVSAWRVFLLIGLVVAFFGLAEAFFSQHAARAAFFGFLTLVFVGLMTYPSRPRR
jgi:hypothetical protein